MDRSQQKKYRSMFHQWTDHICSIDFKRIPGYATEGTEVTREQIDAIADKPCCYCDRKGMVLLNEGFELWENSRDILMALDRIPHGLLEDIYKMEIKRYDGIVPDPRETDDPGEKVRRIIYHLYLPCLITAHRVGKKHY